MILKFVDSAVVFRKLLIRLLIRLALALEFRSLLFLLEQLLLQLIKLFFIVQNKFRHISIQNIFASSRQHFCNT